MGRCAHHAARHRRCAAILLARRLMSSRCTWSLCCCLLVAVSATPALAQSGVELPPSSRRTTNPRTTVDRAGVFFDSLALLAIEHGIRIALQPKTRDALSGKFWNDY